MQVVIAGGGVAGLAAGLLLARGGHHVDLLEADPAPPPDPPVDAFFGWDRPGVSQHRLPHQFMPRLRTVLRERAPDVLDGLMEAGATENEMFRKIPGGEWLPADEDLVSIFARRPVFEAVLRRKAIESGVTLHPGVPAEALLLRAGVPVGVRTPGGDLTAELVVDATGRRTPVARWLSQHGLPAPAEERSDCEVVYYCRHYQLVPGAEYPDMPGPLGGPVGDIASLRFALFRGDNRTHTILLGGSASDRPLRELRHAPVFDAVVRLVPPLTPYLESTFAQPTTDILAMGGLNNVRRHYMRDGAPLLPGLVAIGDSYCHTDPLFGWGASFAVAHAAALADAAARATRGAEVNELLEMAISDEADSAFRAATEEDRARDREWRGENVAPDPEREKGTFIRKVVGPAAPFDPVVFRALLRRVTLLDSPEDLYGNHDVQQRALAVAARMAGAPRPFRAPTREEIGTAIDGARRTS